MQPPDETVEEVHGNDASKRAINADVTAMQKDLLSTLEVIF